MKLKKIIESHAQATTKESLGQNLGDGFLVSHNRIYRNIRQQTLKSGYQFDVSPKADFLVFPFSQLENILQSQKIPYLNNVDVLNNLVIKLQDQVSWDELTDGFRRNYIFHESCHAVARSFVQVFPKGLEKIYQLLLEESFANTCELMAVLDVKDSMHRFFYEVNSYTFLFEAQSFLKSGCESIGEVELFQMLMISYFFANVLKSGLSPSDFDFILNSVVTNDRKLSKTELKNLKSLCQIPFTLDLRFRTLTTGLYLKLMGLSMDRARLQQVTNFDLKLISYTKDLAQFALQK